MSLETVEHRVGRMPQGGGAARINQSSGRVPWIRLAGTVVTSAILAGFVACGPSESLAAGKDQPADEVAAHLAAGEFGAAIEIAEAVSDSELRTSLIEQVAKAQLQSGELNAVEQSARRLPAGEVRSRVRQQTRQRRMAGGGSLANPMMLQMMIQNLTGGESTGSPWSTDPSSDDGGRIMWEQNGVWVDPAGVLAQRLTSDVQGHLASLGLKARQAALNQDMAAASSLRFVSLARLEKAVAARAKAGLPPLTTMRHLAGLHRIQYVIAVPEEHDILLAGPAEGWKYNEKGVAVSLTDSQPTLELDDLVTVLRTFSKGGELTFGCSINPRAEGLKAVKEFVEFSNSQGPLPPGGTRNFLAEIQQRMGNQDVQYYGVPENSRVARIVLAADYRMKLIGIGRVKGGAGIPSIFDLLPKFAKHDPLPLDALRWWLTMKYDAILHSPDRLVYEIRGSSVQVQSEDQVVRADGTRVQTGKASPVNAQFAKNFTENYSDLAKRDLVFAELQNVFDLGMAATLLQTEQLAKRVNFNPGVFAADGAYQPQTVTPAKTVESVVNHRVYAGNDIVVQVAGGVRGNIWELAKQAELHRESSELETVPVKAKADHLPEGRWWWDAGK